MKMNLVSVVPLFVSCGIFSNQCFAHSLSIPHAHMDSALVMLFGLAAAAVTVAVLWIKRRG